MVGLIFQFRRECEMKLNFQSRSRIPWTSNLVILVTANSNLENVLVSESDLWLMSSCMSRCQINVNTLSLWFTLLCQPQRPLFRSTMSTQNHLEVCRSCNDRPHLVTSQVMSPTALSVSCVDSARGGLTKLIASHRSFHREREVRIDVVGRC